MNKNDERLGNGQFWWYRDGFFGYKKRLEPGHYCQSICNHQPPITACMYCLKMAFRFVILCATLALATAGNLLGPGAVSYSAVPALAYSAPLSYSAPAITSQSSNIYRSAGNLGQISTYSKSIDTPFSSVRKADVRISNPGYRVAAAPALAYATPAYAAPAAYAAHGPLLGVAYSAAPAVAHVAFDSGVAHYAW